LSGAIGTANVEAKVWNKGATPWVGLIEEATTSAAAKVLVNFLYAQSSEA
jgi:hypothetical protein